MNPNFIILIVELALIYDSVAQVVQFPTEIQLGNYLKQHAAYIDDEKTYKDGGTVKFQDLDQEFYKINTKWETIKHWRMEQEKVCAEIEKNGVNVAENCKGQDPLKTGTGKSFNDEESPCKFLPGGYQEEGSCVFNDVFHNVNLSPPKYPKRRSGDLTPREIYQFDEMACEDANLLATSFPHSNKNKNLAKDYCEYLDTNFNVKCVYVTYHTGSRCEVQGDIPPVETPPPTYRHGDEIIPTPPPTNPPSLPPSPGKLGTCEGKNKKQCNKSSGCKYSKKKGCVEKGGNIDTCQGISKNKCGRNGKNKNCKWNNNKRKCSKSSKNKI